MLFNESITDFIYFNYYRFFQIHSILSLSIKVLSKFKIKYCNYDKFAIASIKDFTEVLEIGLLFISNLILITELFLNEEI